MRGQFSLIFLCFFDQQFSWFDEKFCWVRKTVKERSMSIHVEELVEVWGQMHVVDLWVMFGFSDCNPTCYSDAVASRAYFLITGWLLGRGSHVWFHLIWLERRPHLKVDTNATNFFIIQILKTKETYNYIYIYFLWNKDKYYNSLYSLI